MTKHTAGQGQLGEKERQRERQTAVRSFVNPWTMVNRMHLRPVLWRNETIHLAIAERAPTVPADRRTVTSAAGVCGVNSRSLLVGYSISSRYTAFVRGFEYCDSLRKALPVYRFQ